ncbi:MAG: HEAT repeat domain-containing protein [Candidatus Latescibacterota bacterium]
MRYKRLRAAAIEVLELHGGEIAPEWFWKGLTDPEPHVRLSAVKYLDRLDPKEHRDVFETALYDPHPHIAKVARRLTQGMGYEKIIW